MYSMIDLPVNTEVKLIAIVMASWGRNVYVVLNALYKSKLYL
jgi:hypothetical protein